MKLLNKLTAVLLVAVICACALIMPVSAQEGAIPQPYKTGTVNSDGAVLEYAVYGEQNREVAILISGNGSDMHGLDGSVLAFFSQHFKVLTVSNRGTGNSTRGGGKLTFEVMAKDLVNVINYLGFEKVNIFGFSDGGNLALVFAVNYPERVTSIVPMSANINPFGTKITSQVGIVGNWFWKCVNAAFSHKPEDAVKRDIQQLMVLQPTLTFRDLKGINVPALNIYGENDMIKRVHSKMITKSISGAEELMIVGGGHGSCFEQTDTVIIPALTAFYAKAGIADF